MKKMGTKVTKGREWGGPEGGRDLLVHNQGGAGVPIGVSPVCLLGERQGGIGGKVKRLGVKRGETNPLHKGVKSSTC